MGTVVIGYWYNDLRRQRQATSRPRRVAVLSYQNYFGLGDTSLTGVGDLSREDQQARFGGTFAPTVVVELDGPSTELVETLELGFLPSECSNPPIQG